MIDPPDAILERELASWKEFYQGSLSVIRDSASHVNKPEYRDKAAKLFRECALAWLHMLDERDEPRERKHLLFLILWAAEDVAPRRLGQAWKHLSEVQYCETKGGLKVAVRTELTGIVRDDVANNVPGAMEFAELCKQIGIDLDERPTV